MLLTFPRNLTLWNITTAKWQDVAFTITLKSLLCFVPCTQYYRSVMSVKIVENLLRFDRCVAEREFLGPEDEVLGYCITVIKLTWAHSVGGEVTVVCACLLNAILSGWELYKMILSSFTCDDFKKGVVSVIRFVRYYVTSWLLLSFVTFFVVI